MSSLVTKQKADLLASAAIVCGMCYFSPAIIPVLAGTQAWKFGVDWGLSRLKHKGYISEQSQKSMKIVLDPTWALMYNFYPPVLTTALTPLIVNEATISLCSTLASYTPQVGCSLVAVFAENGVFKLSSAIAGGFLNGVVFKTLDKFSLPISNYLMGNNMDGNSSKPQKVVSTKEKGSTTAKEPELILSSALKNLLSQIVSEFSAPMGNFIRGALTAATLYSLTSSEPEIKGRKDLWLRSIGNAVSYTIGKNLSWGFREGVNYYSTNLDNLNKTLNPVLSFAASFTVVNHLSHFWHEVKPTAFIASEIYYTSRRGLLEFFENYCVKSERYQRLATSKAKDIKID